MPLLELMLVDSEAVSEPDVNKRDAVPPASVERCRGPSKPPIVYLPTTAADFKVQELRERGAQVVQHGNDFVDAEKEAQAVAAARGLTYVSAYNDLQVLLMNMWHASILCVGCFAVVRAMIECLLIDRDSGGRRAGDRRIGAARGAAADCAADGVRDCWRRRSHCRLILRRCHVALMFSPSARWSRGCQHVRIMKVSCLPMSVQCCAQASLRC